MFGGFPAWRRKAKPTLPLPVFTEMPVRVPAVTFGGLPGSADWYPPVMIDAADVADRLLAGGYVARALEVLARLTPDAYGDYLRAFLADGLARFGSGWRYADIVVVLATLADLLQPRTYLEIGVRRGRSLCTVAAGAPAVDVYGFDLWMADYAGMDNPGAAFVEEELGRVGHRGRAVFIDGDSHVTVPRFLAEHPTLTFDLITVDGDHSELGAAQDLAWVLPRLAVGGAVVFDDISHPLHPELLGVWRTLIADQPRFSAWTYAGSGYGVGFALRKF